MNQFRYRLQHCPRRPSDVTARDVPNAFTLLYLLGHLRSGCAASASGGQLTRYSVAQWRRETRIEMLMRHLRAAPSACQLVCAWDGTLLGAGTAAVTGLQSC